MSTPKWNEPFHVRSGARWKRGSSNVPRIGCMRLNGFSGQPYACATLGVTSASSANTNAPRSIASQCADARGGSVQILTRASLKLGHHVDTVGRVVMRVRGLILLGVALAVAGFGAGVAHAAAPGAPTGVTGTPGNAKVTVRWHAPSSNGGVAITG